MTDKLSELLAGVLGALYPHIVFDTKGLLNLLLPCLVVVFVGLLVTIILKFVRSSRRFAYLSVVIALIAMMTVSSYFPVTLIHAGEFAAEQIQQHIETEEPQEQENEHLRIVR